MADFLTTIFSGAETVELPSGAFLFHAGDPVRFIHLIEDGKLTLDRVQPNGQIACFQRAGAGDVLAEASIYARAYHCDARAHSTVRLRRLRKEDFGSQLDRNPTLANAWAAYLARSVQKARLIAEIRSLKTVGDRLNAWLVENEALPAKGHWQSLANELSVSPEALYRELAKRRLQTVQS